MPSKKLDFAVFDADNHMYETPAALTKHVDPKFKGVLDYVDVDGRTKISIKGRISEYIPNPTFMKVAAPGVQEEFFRNGNKDGKSRREILGKAIDAPPAFRELGPRVELMDEQGIDRTLMWPTLASLVEAQLADDPDAICAIITGLNKWMYETWTFNFENRVFATPVITLPDVDNAIKELEWVAERGAKIILVRPAPVPVKGGFRSFALPVYDPFWQAVQDLDITVGMHASDSGYSRYTNEWDGNTGEFQPFKDMSPFAAILGHMSRPIVDTLASAVGHGMLTRFPKLRVLPVENGAGWVPGLLEAFEYAWHMYPNLYEEKPADVFRRNVWVHPFHEEDPTSLINILGADKIVFGSDYPHAEGLADPISFVDELAGISEEHKRMIMGGNLAKVMGVENTKVV